MDVMDSNDRNAYARLARLRDDTTKKVADKRQTGRDDQSPAELIERRVGEIYAEAGKEADAIAAEVVRSAQKEMDKIRRSHPQCPDEFGRPPDADDRAVVFIDSLRRSSPSQADPRRFSELPVDELIRRAE